MGDDAFEAAKSLFLQGIAAFEAGQLASAERHFEASLALLPGRVSTLTNLAATRLRLAKPQAALEALDQALALDPNSLDVWWQRSVALGELERPADALACLDRVLALDPRHAAALQQRAMALNLLRRHGEALTTLDRLLALQPDDAEGWFRHGQTLEHLDRPADGLLSYDHALAVEPGRSLAWSNRGNILKQLGRTNEAAAAFTQAIATGGDAQVNGYFLASLAGQPAPGVAPTQYVQTLFDGYADSFDTHLVEVLRYQAPAVLVRHLRAQVGAATRFHQALDLGCGTGLCAPLLATFTEHIDGVDIAASMVDKARARGIYRHVVQADVAGHLQDSTQRYDLVVAADVFIYIGDLEPVFAGVARVMDSDGIFCFSVEIAGDGAKDFELKPSLRYGQSRQYIHALATRHGFAVQAWVQHPIREDRGQVIDGLYFYLRKD